MINKRSVRTAAFIASLYLLVSGLASTAQAACPASTTQFRAYQADINGDGLADILFVPVPTVIALPLGVDDELIPLVTDPGLPAFNYLSSAAPATVGGIPANAVPVSYQSTVMPGDAAGCGVVILRAQTAGLPTLVGAFSATAGVAPTLVQVLSSAANASRKISYTYDARNRLVATTYADGSPGITRSYTPDGLLGSITAGGSIPSTWTYGYNNRRLLTIETLTLPGVNNSTIQRVYNPNGHLDNLIYPDGTSVDYAPDPLGAPTKVGAFASNVTWAPNGQLASFTYGNNIVHSVDQNVRGLPWHANDIGPTTGVIQDTYIYDEEANILAISDGLPNNVSSRTMSYDGLDRLTAANSPGVWGNASFGYDQLDNLRTSTVGSRNSTHLYDGANRLVQINTNGAPTNYGYDLRANVTSKGNQAFLFDIGNRLIASGSNGYAYDGHGRRTLAYGAGGSQRVQMYSQDGQLLYGTYKPSANAAASSMKYIYLAGKIIAETSGATEVRYLHTDGLGSPVARTDLNGTLIDRTRYEPYGATAAGTNPGTGADNLGFTGHANDPATGLVYMQQRYYDPVAGRFLSVDPVTTDANTGSSFGRYHYGANNPYRYIDPDGRSVGCLSCETVYASPDSSSSGVSGGGLKVSRLAHGLLGAASFAPSVVGSTASFADGLLHLAEGNTSEAGYSLAAAGIGIFVDAGVAKAGLKIAGDAVKGGETAATIAGRQAHKAYEITLGGGYAFNRALPSGKRPDAIDFVNNIVRELKPDSSGGIYRGAKQLQGYVNELESITKQKWQGFLDLYKRQP